MVVAHQLPPNHRVLRKSDGGKLEIHAENWVRSHQARYVPHATKDAGMENLSGIKGEVANWL